MGPELRKDWNQGQLGDRNRFLPVKQNFLAGGRVIRNLVQFIASSIPYRRFDCRGLRQAAQTLLVTLACIAPHDGAHRRVGLQCRHIDGNALALDKPAICRHPQHPREHLAGVEVDQTAGAQDGRTVGCRFVQSNPQKASKTKRVGQPPRNAAF